MVNIEVKVPDIGDFKDVPIIEIHVKPGDKVAAEAPLVTLESDKATMEVPSSAAGTVKELKIKVGDTVSEGSVILLLEAADVAVTAQTPEVAEPVAAPAPEKPAPKPAPQPVSAVVAERETPPSSLLPPHPAQSAAVHASPSIRAFARELGVDLTHVRPTGPKGRILREDVQGYVKGELAKPRGIAGGMGIPEMPVVDFAKWGPVEARPLQRIKKLSGANLHRAWLNVPHVTQHDEADITELEAFRKTMADEAAKSGVKLTVLAFLMKAVVTALKKYPEFNASLEAGGESLILKHYYHIGVAVDTPDGLVVPVIRDVDQKGIVDLARDLATLSQKARDKKLGPAEMQGGSFTISSLGGIGGTAFTPIVNAPEVAILGVSKSAMKPAWNGQEFVPRLMLPLSLSYDHRVIDGAAGARFAAHLATLLGDIRRLVL